MNSPLLNGDTYTCAIINDKKNNIKFSKGGIV